MRKGFLVLLMLSDCTGEDASEKSAVASSARPDDVRKRTPDGVQAGF